MDVKVSENSTIRYRNVVTYAELHEFCLGLKETLDSTAGASLDAFINGRYGTWEYVQGNKKYTLMTLAKEGDLVEVDFTFTRNYNKKSK